MDQMQFVYPFLALVPWFLVNYQVPKISGWAEVADKYPEKFSFTGEWRKKQAMLMRKDGGRKVPARYGGCIWMGWNETALYLQVRPAITFGVWHKPLQIPWTAISADGETTAYGKQYVQLKVSGTPVTLMFQPDTIEPARKYFQAG